MAAFIATATAFRSRCRSGRRAALLVANRMSWGMVTVSDVPLLTTLVWFDTLPANGSVRWNGNLFAAGNWVSAADIAAGLLTYLPQPAAWNAAAPSAISTRWSAAPSIR